MSTSSVTESEVFSEGAMHPKLTEKDIQEIRYSIKHTFVDSLGKELKQHPDICSGYALDDMSLEELRELAINVRLAKGITKAKGSTTTTWAQTKSSTTSVTGDDVIDQEGAHAGAGLAATTNPTTANQPPPLVSQPPPPPRAPAPTSDMASVMQMMMQSQQAAAEDQRREDRRPHGGPHV